MPPHKIELVADAPPTPVTRCIVERAMVLANEGLSADGRVVARQCILDWFGVALAGASEPLVGMLTVQALADGGTPQATVIGGGRRFNARQAALLNGAMGHALDYDDVNLDAHGHVTAAVLPATLAVGELLDATGGQLVRAFAAGYETVAMIGRFVGREHYDCGFHATATLGTYGATAASAIIAGLDSRAMQRALGIAGTQAGGLKSQFGTMCKPLNAGKANENGLVATLLAQRGFTSCLDILECPQGLADTQAGESHPAKALEAPRRAEHVRENLFKFSAACYGTHAAIIAAENLMRRHMLQREEIARVEGRIEASADRVCNIQTPRSGLEAKFSLRFNVALVLSGISTAAPSTYSDGIAADPELRSMLDRITVRIMPAGWPVSVKEVEIETLAGERYVERIDTSIPEADLTIQQRRVEDKFLVLAAPVLGSASAEALLQTIAQLEEDGTRVADLMQIVR